MITLIYTHAFVLRSSSFIFCCLCFYFLYLVFVCFYFFFFFSSRRRHTRCSRDWSSDVCSSDLSGNILPVKHPKPLDLRKLKVLPLEQRRSLTRVEDILVPPNDPAAEISTPAKDRKSTRLNSSHGYISYAVFCLKKKTKKKHIHT